MIWKIYLTVLFTCIYVLIWRLFHCVVFLHLPCYVFLILFDDNLALYVIIVLVFGHYGIFWGFPCKSLLHVCFVDASHFCD